MRMLSLALCFFLITSISYCQTSTLKGRVLDGATGNGLPAATIRIENSSRGTISNQNGDFSLVVQNGPSTIIISYLGYITKSLSIIAPMDSLLIIKLESAPVELPALTIISEDPAYDIVRKAIANKRIWKSILHDYKFDSFTRTVISRDTSISMIAESYSTGYWRKGDTLREVVTQKRQTQNIPMSENFTEARGITNFSDDTIRFSGYSAIGPLADNAFDYYDYSLLNTEKQNGKEIFKISLTPKTKTIPLFRGTMFINDGTFALIGIEFEPNEAISFPFLKSFSLHFKQQYAIFEDRFWLPVDIRVNGLMTIGILGLSLSPFGFEQTSSNYDYSINKEIPDSIFHQPRVTTDSSAERYDSTFWKTNSFLPPTSREEIAYKTIDSIQKSEVQFKPSGIMATLGSPEWIMKNISFLDLHFNRVEGFYSGIDGLIEIFKKSLTFNPHLGYPFFQKQLEVGSSIEYAFDTTGRWNLGVDGHRWITHTGAETYGTLVNSLTCLMGKDDFYDYYKTEGWKNWIRFKPNNFEMTFTYLDELQSSILQTTNYSWFSRGRGYRVQPLINDGRLRSLSISCNYGQPKNIFTPVQTGIILNFTAEFSPHGLLASSFDYSQYSFSFQQDIITFGKNFLFKPFLRLYAQGGASFGTTPFQKLFVLESQLSGLSSDNVLRTSNPREFYGDKYLIISIEHNFRTLPFLATGIPFLYERNLDLILHTTFARSWILSRTTQNLPIIPHTTDGWLAEYGFGLSRILDFFRVDLTWRYGGPSRSYPAITVGIATIF